LKWNSDFFDLHSFNHLYGWCCLLFSQIKPTHYLEWLFRQGILDYLLFDFFWPAKIFSVGVYILTDRSAIRVVDKILTQIICFSVHLIKLVVITLSKVIIWSSLMLSMDGSDDQNIPNKKSLMNEADSSAAISTLTIKQ
jgi:hypothetical protein